MAYKQHWSDAFVDKWLVPTIFGVLSGAYQWMLNGNWLDIVAYSAFGFFMPFVAIRIPDIWKDPRVVAMILAIVAIVLYMCIC